tara:strand:- start:305 stop:937 length:633 start_codon:yes stop_codon:yes gene_type:complete
MSDILRQVDEDLRKDKLLRIWRSYRIFIVGFILIIIVSLAGYQYYLSNEQSKNEAVVEKYVNALNENNTSKSINQLIELDESSNAFIKGLAKLKRAELHFINNEEEIALELFEATANDRSLNRIIRDLAQYKLLMVQLDTIDKETYLKIIDQQNINENKFYHHLQELKAIKLLLEGDRNGSLRIFELILSSDESPIDIKTRSEKFIKILK